MHGPRRQGERGSMSRPLRSLRLPALPCAAWRGHPALAIVELRDQHTKPSLHKANSVGRSPARTLPAHRLCVRVRVCVNCGRVRACVREWRVCECETVAPHHAQKAQPRSSRAASSPRATSVSLSILITLAAPGAVEINTSTVARRYSSTCTALAAGARRVWGPRGGQPRSRCRFFGCRPLRRVYIFVS